MSNPSKKERKLLESLGKSGIHVVNFARESQAPIVSERIQKEKPWVFWGQDNLYPNKLIRLADNSALHSAILDTKAKMIAGESIIYESENSAAEKFLTDATGVGGTTISKLIKAISVDVAYFKGLVLNVQFDLNGKVNELKHTDYSYVRSGKVDIKTRRISSFYHSPRWDIATNKKVYKEYEEIYRPVEILAFNGKKFRDTKSKNGGQFIVNKSYSPATTYYPKPSYLGATNYIEIAAKIANFHKSQLDNGMAGNMHMHIPKDLTDPNVREKVLQQLNDQYTGTNNAGRIVLTYGVGEGNKVDVTPIETTGVHEALSSLNERVNQEIVSGHGIPRILTQLDQKSGLGGVQTAEAIDMYQTLKISPEQQVIEDTLNDILEFNGINEKIKIKALKPTTLILSDELMKLAATVDEIREIAKLEPHKDPEIGEKLLIENDNGKRSTTDNEK
jgi:hypothetical protein